MKSHLSLSALIAFSLAACSSGEGESFSYKTFEAVNEIAKVEKLNNAPCSNTLEFENLALQQKCWSLTVEDLDEAGKISLDLGLKLSEAHDGEIEIIKKSEEIMIARRKADESCADYMVIDLNNADLLGEDNLPATLEVAIATTEKQHCGELSKTYEAI